MKRKLPIFALIESGLTILYFFPIWWIVPWNTQIFNVPLSVKSNIYGLILAIVTLTLVIIYLLVKKIAQKTYKGFYITLCVFTLALVPVFLMYSAGIFWLEVGFPRQS